MSVPRVALHQDERGGPQVFVYTAAEQRVHARRVVLGAKRSGDVDIAGWLAAGEMVVVGARESLRDGMAAHPINQPIVVTGTAPASKLGRDRVTRQVGLGVRRETADN